MNATTTHKKTYRNGYHVSRATAPREAAALAAVQSAYVELTDQGVYPSVERIAGKVRMTTGVVSSLRSRLVADGVVPPSASPYAAWSVDDPFEEHPDDPDADEVRARIAEVRAEKEASAPPTPMGVMRAKHHRRFLKRLSA